MTPIAEMLESMIENFALNTGGRPAVIRMSVGCFERLRIEADKMLRFPLDLKKPSYKGIDIEVFK